MEITPDQTEFDSFHSSDAEPLDPLFNQCVQCVVDEGQASTSLLQRRLKLDYTRAARIMDEMEDQGIIGPYRGSQPREVLYKPEYTMDSEVSFATGTTAPVPPKESIWQKVLTCLVPMLRLVVRWFFKPIPFLIYCACSVLMCVLLYGIQSGWFWVVEIFFAVAIIYVIVRVAWLLFLLLVYAFFYTKAMLKCKLHQFKEWNDSFVFSQPSRTPKSTSVLDMDTMDGHTFEYFCAELLRQNGFLNVEVTQASGDYGIDVLAEKEGVTYAVQCKCYSDNVGNHAVQEAHSGAAYYECMVPVVMTNRYFTRAAKETATQIHVLLWDRDKLLQMMEK